MRALPLPPPSLAFWNMTPLSTRQSPTSPPGSFSTFAYRLTSTDGGPPPGDGVRTVNTASRASSAMRGPKREVNLVPMHEFSTWRDRGWVAGGVGTGRGRGPPPACHPAHRHCHPPQPSHPLVRACLEHFLPVVDVHIKRRLAHGSQRGFERSCVAPDDDGRVHAALQEDLRRRQQLSSCGGWGRGAWEGDGWVGGRRGAAPAAWKGTRGQRNDGKRTGPTARPG